MPANALALLRLRHSSNRLPYGSDYLSGEEARCAGGTWYREGKRRALVLWKVVVGWVSEEPRLLAKENRLGPSELNVEVQSLLSYVRRW